MLILFHHYNDLKKCKSEVERIKKTTVYTENKRVMIMMKGDEEKEELSNTTLELRSWVQISPSPLLSDIELRH
jgi:hypothetical protein